MNCLIISHTPHYMENDQIVGWGSTVREIDQLARLFTRVVHLAPLYAEPNPGSALPYQAKNVRLVRVRPAGGSSLCDKLAILWAYPAYLKLMLAEFRQADLVHVRCPANISLLAMLLLTFVREPRARWFKYAGNWQLSEREPITYRFQRWWLSRGFPGGIVTINGDWPNQPSHVFSFYNPCLDEKEIQFAHDQCSQKELTEPLQLLFVGALTDYKGVQDVLAIAEQLKYRSIDFELHLVGDGPGRAGYEAWTSHHGLAERVKFHGWIARTALAPFYQRAHLMVFPSRTEGWPKVLSEAMAFGVVPLASAVSSIPHILAATGAGLAIPVGDLSAYVTAITQFLDAPQSWKRASLAGIAAAQHFTFSAYLQSIIQMLDAEYGIQFENW